MLKENRKSLICKIHIAKSQLTMDDVTYRQLLVMVVNKSSCSEMTVPELCQVLRELEKKGFRVKAKNDKRQSNWAEGRKPYLAKIKALLYNQGKTMEYADGIAQKAFGVQFVNWLDVPKLKKVIQMLEVYKHRHQ